MKRTLRDLITYAQFNIDGERVMMQKMLGSWNRLQLHLLVQVFFEHAPKESM